MQTMLALPGTTPSNCTHYMAREVHLARNVHRLQLTQGHYVRATVVQEANSCGRVQHRGQGVSPGV